MGWGLVRCGPNSGDREKPGGGDKLGQGGLSTNDRRATSTGTAGPGDRHPGRPGPARGPVRDRAPRGADLPAVPGGRARARHHVPVPVRRVQPEAVRIRGAQRTRSSRRPALAQEDLPRRHAGDAAPVPGAEPAGRHRRRPAPVQAELPAPRQPLPRGRAPGPDPVRRAGAASLHVPRAPRGHGPRGRRGDDRLRLRPARDAGGRHRAPGPGLRHRRAPVPVHRGGHRAPGRQVRRAVAVRRPAAGAGHPAVLRLARADRGDRRGLGAAGHRRDPGAGRGAARGLAGRALRPVRADPG